MLRTQYYLARAHEGTRRAELAGLLMTILLFPRDGQDSKQQQKNRLNSRWQNPQRERPRVFRHFRSS